MRQLTSTAAELKILQNLPVAIRLYLSDNFLQDCISNVKSQFSKETFHYNIEFEKNEVVYHLEFDENGRLLKQDQALLNNDGYTYEDFFDD